ncbi:MAG: hypothetical protein ABIK07_19940 [Planctomycetota bacterium]
MNHTSDNTAKVSRPYLKPMIIGLVCLIAIGLIVVLGFRLFVTETSLTIINSSSQEMQHGVLLDQEGHELFRAESMVPNERLSRTLYNLKPSGSMTFQATLADGTTRKGAFSFDEDRKASEIHLPLLSYEITDQTLIIKSEVGERLTIKQRIRLRAFW